MDYQKTASEILKHIGGEKNVVSLEHCSTRLRFILADRSKADADAVKKIPGVMGVADKVQFQIIIGNSVVEVYEAILKQASFSGDAKAEKKSEKSNIGRTVMEFVIAVFQPIIPAIAGGGILKAMLSLCVLIGILDNTSTLFTILNLLGDAPLYFLPLMVAVSASKRLKVNSFVALSVVGALLLPNMTTLLSAEGGTVFLGFTLQKIAYAYQIFPALLSMFLLAAVERFFNKIVPKPVRILFVPMLCLLIVVPSTLLVLGPLGYNFGTLLTSAILFLYDKLGFIAVGLLAMVLPFCTAAGMHKAFVPYAISSLASMGSELVYLPANLAHNISESGACFGVVLRTKNKELRTTALSAGISALFGITEPALYGVTLQNKRVTLDVMAGALLSGLSIGFTVVRAYTIVGPGLASMATFIDPEGINTMNIVWAFVGFAIAFLVAFVVTLVIFKDENETVEEASKIPAEAAPGTSAAAASETVLYCPTAGKVIPLTEVPDEVFSQKILGDGAAILPEEGVVRAPADGTIALVADTGHAIGMILDNGAELIMHVGLDTVELGGKFFDVKTENGKKVRRGEILLQYDIEEIKKAGYDVTMPVIVTSGEAFEVLAASSGSRSAADEFYHIRRRTV